MAGQAGQLSFWSLNIGLAWMMFATLLPLGVVQLYYSVNEGYFEARALSFITRPGNATLEWLRIPGDIIFIAGGVLPLLWITWLGVRYAREATTHDVPIEALYTELEPVGAAAQAPGRLRFGSDSRPDETDLRAGEQSRWRSQRRGPDTSGDGPGRAG
jgi:nitric oxide reductase subunit B